MMPQNYPTLGNTLQVVRASAVLGLLPRITQQTNLAVNGEHGEWWRMPHPWSTARTQAVRH